MSFKQKMNSLKKYDVVKNSYKFFIGSATIILIGIIVFVLFGFNLGMDFTGGTVLQIKVGAALEQGDTYTTYTNEIATILEDNGLTLSLKQLEGEGDSASILVRFQDISGYSESQMSDLIDTVTAQIEDTLNPGDVNPSFQIEQSQRIGPSATASLLLNAFLAVLIATILILIYIAFRFELLSGLAAILALIHDVLVMSSLVLIFQIEINSAFIAALITIIGYSINDTIVVFDRVRENRRNDVYEHENNAFIVNKSIRETFVRSVNTSLTTLFTITVLAVISVSSIREFAIPIIFGLIAGTYSSIFIATPIWALVNDHTRPRNRNAKTLATIKVKETTSKEDNKITV
ncbi:MAG: protein translocase subunit SecF [Spirochaetales bacterium]